MKRLLVASDLGRGSENALARGVRLASATGAALRVAHVLESGDESQSSRARDALTIAIERAVDGEASAVAPSRSVRILTGDPAGAILGEAESCNADLILMGAHGEPRLRDVIFGTTTTNVVRHGARPVLVVQSDGRADYRRVLAAADSLATAQRLLGLANHIAPTAELYAVHAFDPSLRQALAGRGALEREAERREMEMQDVIDRTVADRAKRVSAKQHAIVEPGDATSVLMKEAEALAPDLVAIGTRRGSHYLGSHAVDMLFWVAGDLLIVPDGGGEDPAATLA